MDRESIFELQKIDCNCNDCKFMLRDEIEFNLWKGFTEHLQYFEFLRSRHVLLGAAGNAIDNRSKLGMNELKRQAFKLKFQFDTSQLTIQHGVCLNRKWKWNQPISFIPNTLQLNTQHCFVHRRI